jgi:hypothetical protein
MVFYGDHPINLFKQDAKSELLGGPNLVITFCSRATQGLDVGVPSLVLGSISKTIMASGNLVTSCNYKDLMGEAEDITLISSKQQIEVVADILKKTTTMSQFWL